ncbi:hypothetical protein FPV67DRAFT_1631942 [Lyophyllum atratum]|nr:hypothetical protein FPV67DRAFT_1631942 [Lyophyllum atratum]
MPALRGQEATENITQDIATRAPAPATAEATSKKAAWTHADTTHFLEYLIEHKSEAGDGGNFKVATWRACAAHLNETLTKGAQKTYLSCKGKYRTLKSTYDIVCLIRDNSGWSWDDEEGASITPEKKGTWDDFKAKHPDAAPFRNKGWPYLASFDSLIPSKAKGNHAFRASQGPRPVLDQQSQDLDGDDIGAPDEAWQAFEVEEDDGGARADDEDEEDIPESAPEPSPRSVPMTPAPSSSRKRTAAAPTSASAAKTPRLSAGAQGIADIGRSMGRFTEVLENVFAPTQTGLEATPRRKQRAIGQAQELEDGWLSEDDLIKFIDVLEKDVAAVDTYLVLKKESLRKKWVRGKLDSLYF